MQIFVQIGWIFSSHFPSLCLRQLCQWVGQESNLTTWQSRRYVWSKHGHSFCFWFSFLFLAILFTVEIEKVKQLIETCIDSKWQNMKIPCLLQLRETGKSRRKTLRQQTSSGELFCVYRNLRSFFHSAFDLFAAFISISFMTIFLLSFCRLLLPVINFNFLSLFSTHRKSQLTRVRSNIVIG